MIATVRPSTLSGNINAPASKSSMQRACAAGLLAKGSSIIRNPGHSNDDLAAISIVRNLGAQAITQDNKLLIESSDFMQGRDASPVTINCGESGLSIRMFTPIAALLDREIIITGEGSLLNRPMDFFDKVLPGLGVSIHSNNGRLPLRIHGPLHPKNIDVDGSLSSQFLTGLLMAYSAAGADDVLVRVNNLTSRPYIDLTIDVMRKFGLKIPENRNYEEFYFSRANNDDHSMSHDYTVEGDWSGGAFLLVAGCIAGPVTVRGLDMLSTQADRKVMEALSMANASVAVDAKGIKLRPKTLNAFEFDATDCPDLFPPLVALSAYAQGQTMLRGVSRLTHKESDRANSLRQEFGRLGVEIDVEDDVMIIHGGGELMGTRVHSHHDHRIAMACAVAALGAKSEIIIESADAVAKSYPDFFEDLKKLNAAVSLSTDIKWHE